MDILFKNATVVTMDEAGGLNPVLKNCCVGIEKTKISYIGNWTDTLKANRIIDCSKKILMPSLINCHTHTPMSLLRGYASDLNLQQWLFDYIFPAEDKMTKKDCYIGTLLSAAEMIASGTASFTDMYFNLDAVSDAVFEAKVKACLSNSVIAFDSENFNFKNDSSYIQSMYVLEKYCNATSGRIKLDASIHAEYTSSYKAWLQVIEFAKEHNLNMHVHISETQYEHENCKLKYGITPTQIFNKYGLFDIKTNAAHCVFLEQCDLEIFAQNGVSVAHNPVSNLKLGSGIANVNEMLNYKINVSLGTDGMASNNSYDLFEEIKLASILQKGVLKNPAAVCAYEALKMATVNGAIAQGRENECGMIKLGYDADIILIDTDNERLTPIIDPISTIAYSATGRDVCLTMCLGEILYENGSHKTIDVEKVVYYVSNRTL